MKYDNIKNSLQRVLSLLEDCEREGMSAMEYDLIIKELREAYSTFRFECCPDGGTQTEHSERINAEVAPAPTEEPAPAEPTEPEAVTEQPVVQPQTEEPTVAEPAAEAAEEVEVAEVAEPAEQHNEEPKNEAPKNEEPKNEISGFFNTSETAQSRHRLFVRALYDEAGDSEIAHTEQPAQESVAEPAADEHPDTDKAAAAHTDDVQPVETVEAVDAEPAPEVSEPAAEEPAATQEPQHETTPAATEPVQEHHAAPEVHHIAEHTAETVIGDLINADVRTIADTITPAGNAVADIVGKESIGSIREAIGINDRFLLMRDLFEGSAEQFEQAVAKLDSFATLDECMVHIIDTYDWNPNCDGAKLIMTLIERRYGSRNA